MGEYQNVGISEQGHSNWGKWVGMYDYEFITFITYFYTYKVCIADLDLATDAVLQMDKISKKYPVLITTKI